MSLLLLFFSNKILLKEIKLYSLVNSYLSSLPKIIAGKAVVFLGEFLNTEVLQGTYRVRTQGHVHIIIINNLIWWLIIFLMIRHHHNGRWEARIGRVFGNKYLYLGTYGKPLLRNFFIIMKQYIYTYMGN